VEIMVALSVAMRLEWVFPRHPVAVPWAKLGEFPVNTAHL